MKRPLPFDERNAEDFLDTTRRIDNALTAIEKTHGPVTKANLARLSEVHRNTLYNRARSTSPDNDPENGWPFTALNKIKKSRIQPAINEIPKEQKERSHESEILRLRTHLAKSRYVAGTWFHRTLKLKQERDEARRQVDLLLSHSETLRNEIDMLRQQRQKTIKVVKS
jgi:hypothetical protein